MVRLSWFTRETLTLYHKESPSRAFASSFANRDWNAMIRSCSVIRTCNSAEKLHSRVLSSCDVRGFSWTEVGVWVRNVRRLWKKIKQRLRIQRLLSNWTFVPESSPEYFQSSPLLKLHSASAKIRDSWPPLFLPSDFLCRLVLRLSNGDYKLNRADNDARKIISSQSRRECDW